MRITDLTNVRRAFQSAAWVIHEPKLEALTEVLSMRLSDTPLTAEEIQARIGDRPRASGQTIGSVAVIPLAGTLYPKANLVTESSGGASVEQFIAQVEAAANDPAIGAIVIDTDSPGGAAQGIPEAAARLRALRGTKPIVAVASGLMASGAYWLASQADSIVGAPSSEIGSVGAFMVHQDMSEAYAKDGVKNTIVRAGKYKAETNPFEPLTDEAREALQARVDDAYTLFLGDLAKGRRVSVATAKNDFGQGRVLGPKAAMAAGMIDKLGTLQSVVRDLSGPKAKQYMRASDGALPVFADADDVPLTVSDLTALVAEALAGDALVGATHTSLMVTPTRAGAPTVLESSSDSTPPVAEEHTVDKPTTAPDGVAVATPSRADLLVELAELTGKTDQIGAWIKSGKSVDEIRNEIKASQSSPAAVVTVGATRETQKPWDSYGQFALAVMDAGINGRPSDMRLMAAATGMSQNSPTGGGYATPGEFATNVWEGAFGDPSSIVGLTDQYDIDGPFLELPRFKDTDRSADAVYGGIKAYFNAEAAQMTGSSAVMSNMRLEPHEMHVLTYATERLLNNSPYAFGQFIMRAQAEAIRLKTNKVLLNSTAAGMPQGILNAPCKITVSKEGSQAADTINAKNIGKMKARRIAGYTRQYVWLANTDIQPELDNLSTVVMNVASTENVGGYSSPLYNPDTDRLGGLPVIWNDHCEALGDEGDLILVYLKGHAVGTRRAGIRTAESIHLRFDYGEKAFRSTFEIDAQSWLESALTPAKGSTKSTHITLQAR